MPGRITSAGFSRRARQKWRVGPLQLRLDAYLPEAHLPADLVTMTLDPLGSRVHLRESPASTPRTSTTVDGTVVRSEADRSIALTSLDSMGFDTSLPATQGVEIHENCGLHVRQHVGSNFKYSQVVGQHVGRQMRNSTAKMTGRERRGLEMLASGHRVAESSTRGEFFVPSESGNGIYKITGVGVGGAPELCGCDDFAGRNAPCKHIFAVRHWLAGATLPPGVALPSPPPKRVRPNQAAYDLAQSEEYRLFGILLRDLCSGISEPERDSHAAGRPPIPLREQAYCAIQKAYLGFSCRRSEGFRADSVVKGQLSAVPYWDVPSKFFVL